jgi:hypothetical protein
MGSELTYLEDRDYDVDDSFVIALENIDHEMAKLIAVYLEDHMLNLPTNDFTTHIYGGIVHYFDKPIPFVVEVLKASGSFLTFTDLKFIDMNEYLDLVNLNLYIKSNGTYAYPNFSEINKRYNASKPSA